MPPCLRGDLKEYGDGKGGTTWKAYGVKEPPVTSQIIQSGQGTDSVACLRTSVACYKGTAVEKKRSTSSVAGSNTCDLTDASVRLKVA